MNLSCQVGKTLGIGYTYSCVKVQDPLFLHTEEAHTLIVER